MSASSTRLITEALNIDRFAMVVGWSDTQG
jgi:hypothetical protein